MNKIFKSKKVILMVLILALSTFIIAGVSTLIDYQKTKDIIQSSLKDLVQSEKENIIHLYKSGISKDSIITLFNNSERHWHSIGKIGALGIAELKGDSIYILFRSGQKYNKMPVLYFKSTHLSSPMRKALQKEEGFIQGIDYDSNEIFGAYTYIDELNWGLVSKIHVSEINQPYLTGIYITTILAIIFISLGTFLFIKITNPMLNQIIDSEEKYRTLVEGMNEGLMQVDNDDTIQYVNQSICNIFGYTKDELIGKRGSDIIIFKEDKHLIINKNKSRLDNISERYEIRGVKKSGEIVWLFISGTPLYDSSGEVVGSIGIISDISKQKQAEAELKIEKTFLEELFETAPEAIITLDNDDRVLKINKEFTKIFEYSPEEAIGQYINDLIVPKDLKEEALKATTDVSIGKRINFETIRKNKNGKLINVSVLGNPIVQDGKQLAVFGIYRDISEKKRRENSIKESEEKFRTLVENIPGVSYRCANDKDWTMAFLSEQAKKITGYDSDEFINNKIRSYNSIIHSEDIEKVDNAVQNAVKTKEAYTMEYRIFNSSGKIKWIYEKGQGVFDDRGNLICLDGVLIDITERVKAEEELKQRQEFIQIILDNLPIGVALNSINDGTASYINKKFSEIYGWPKEELLDVEKFFHKVYPDESYRNELMTRVMNDINSMDASRMRWENIVATGKDGSKRVINCQNIPLLEQNTMVSTVIDITKQKRAEEELQKFTKMESLGVIAGGIAHNFKNILANISFNVGLAKYKPETLSKNIEKIEQAINQASALARRFQTFSTGGEPILGVISVRDILEGVIKIAESGSHNIIEIIYSPDLHNVKADPNQLNEVFINLVINANQAMPVAGKIAIKADNINLNSINDFNLEQGKYVKVSFHDQGIGIPKELLSKIFDPFFTTKSEGQGLGLSSVHYIIHKHKGAITVDSEQGKWTQFDIYLPASDATLMTKEQNMETLKTGACKRILYMDDNESLRENIIEIGELLDYEIDAVADGYNAIKYYQEAFSAGNTYSAVILDLTIQGSDMQGDDVLSELLKIDPNVKAIVFSGHSTKPIVANYKDYGFKGRLDKPVTIDNLANVLREVCG